MTIVVDADEDAARRIEANLYKLVNVLRVDDMTHAATVVRELALVKVRTDDGDAGRGDAALRGVPRARRRRGAGGARGRDHRAQRQDRRPRGGAPALRRARAGAHGGGGDARGAEADGDDCRPRRRCADDDAAKADDRGDAAA